MKEYFFELVLSQNEKIIVESEFPLYDIDCCFEVSIFLLNNQKKILIAHDSFRYRMDRLRSLLEKALQKDLLLHESIMEDIGYLYNQYSRYICVKNSKTSTIFVFQKEESGESWVGMNYYLWASSDLVSWIYNDGEGNIIFEITPFYPFLYTGAKKELNYILFQKWIKDYRPYFIQKISKETAQQWLEKANYIVQQIDDNVARWKKEIENK